MSGSLRKRPNCCVAANRRDVPKPDIGCGLCYHFVGAGDCIDDTSSPSALAVLRLEKQTMQKMTRRVLGAAGLTLIVTTSAVWAPEAQPGRVPRENAQRERQNPYIKCRDGPKR